MHRLVVLFGFLAALSNASFAANAPDTLMVTGPAFQQVPSASILVTPPGGSQTTLGDALANAGTAYTGASPIVVTGTVVGCPTCGTSGANVQSVGVASANGLSGTVANPTTTPVITLSTSITGLLKGNGTAVSAATAGTDYLAPAGSGAALTGITWTQIGSTPTTLAGYGITSPLPSAQGGTGVNNGSNTITTSLNFAITGSGAQTFFFGNSGVPWTYNFPQATATLAYQVGSLVSGHCLEASGTTGGVADAGAVCGSGGSGITTLTGDVAAGPGSGSQAATLATVNSNVGSFTSANITVNAKGLITAAANGSGGGSGCVPAGLLNQILLDSGSGACADSTITLTGAAFTGPSGATATTVSITGSTATNASAAGGAIQYTGGTGGANGVGGGFTAAGGAGSATNAAGGVASMTGGAGAGTGNGGHASLVGGNSGAGATGNAGDASMNGGTALSTNGNGGSVVLAAGAGAGTGPGGVVSFTGGVSGATGSAGAADVIGGAGATGSQAAGGIVNITGGASGNGALAHGGAVVILGGASLATNGAGGNVSMTGGTPTGNQAGGSASMVGGIGSASGSAPGVASVTGGAGGAAAVAGAAVTIAGGASGSGSTGAGGAASVLGGAAVSTNGAGGQVNLTGGAGTGTGNGGNLVFTPGVAGGSGAAGVINHVAATNNFGTQQTLQGSLVLANTASGAFATTLQSSNSATAAYTITLPPAPPGTSGFVLSATTGGVASWVANGGGGGVTWPTSGDVVISNGTSTPAGAAFGTTVVNNSGVINTTAPDTVHTSSATTANIGGQDDYNAASLTATLATLATGQTLAVVTTGNALTLALGGQTVIGLPLATTLHAYGSYGFTYNSAGSLTGYGFPGFGTITTNALGKFDDGTGAMTASSVTDNGTLIATAEPLVLNSATGGSQGAGTINASGLYVNGVAVSAGGGASLSANQAFTGINTFAAVLGGINVQSGTTYTTVASDCGKTLLMTGTSPVITIAASIAPASGTACVIGVIQGGSTKASVNGTAVSAASLISASSYTGTSGTLGAVIDLVLTTVSSTATAYLTGNGS